MVLALLNMFFLLLRKQDGVDMQLEDDFINISPYELAKKRIFKINDFIPQDINTTI